MNIQKEVESAAQRQRAGRQKHFLHFTEFEHQYAAASLIHYRDSRVSISRQRRDVGRLYCLLSSLPVSALKQKLRAYCGGLVSHSVSESSQSRAKISRRAEQNGMERTLSCIFRSSFSSLEEHLFKVNGRKEMAQKSEWRISCLHCRPIRADSEQKVRLCRESGVRRRLRGLVSVKRSGSLLFRASRKTETVSWKERRPARVQRCEKEVQ